MKIQLITQNKIFFNDNLITVSNYSHPMSPDDFDINVIDLSYAEIWRHNGPQIGKLNIYNDLVSISKMIDDATKTIVIYVYPQDVTYDYHYLGGTYKSGIKIKELISTGQYDLGYEACFSKNYPALDIVFEPTKTIIHKVEYSADFRFANDIGKVVTKSENSEKTTTLKNDHEHYFTTLDICSSVEKMKTFINEYFVTTIPQIPEWVSNFVFWNDSDSKATIESSKKQIAELNRKIENAQESLIKNNRYKSILFTNGEELVEVVFEILEKILQCDLSTFIDEKKEDFRVAKDKYVFIGEIKGINTNVKNENISQLDVHYQRYIDEKDDEIETSNIHAILIINPLRNRCIEERDPVGEQQINLARRNNSLIIETVTLLKMFELFLGGKLSTEKCIEMLANNVGILKI